MKLLLGLGIFYYVVVEIALICLLLNKEAGAKHMKKKKWFRKPKHMAESV